MKTQGRWLAAVLLLLSAFLVGSDAPQTSEDPEVSDSAVEKAGADLTEIRSRAKSMPIDQRIDIDKRIGATIAGVNSKAEGKGPAVATRLATELETSKDALLDEKGRLGLSWGEMMIAHTLLANAGEKVTLSDLVTLHGEGLSWGAIAYGLRFHMEDFEDAIKAQGKVAMGLAKPNKKSAADEK